MFDTPIEGEMDDMPSSSDDAEFVGVAQGVMDQLSDLIMLQQQQIQALMILSQQMQTFMTAPRRVIRDDAGRVIGATIEGQ